MHDEPRPPESAPPLPKIGSYRLLEPLGSGGMSSVFRAVHEESGLEVAVKVLPRTLAKNSTMLQRFLREAKSAESLEHPNIVAIYDRGTENGRYYLVLEYVPGGDLHDRIRSRGAMPVDEAIPIIKAVVHGLNHAAQRGLIHRDIKPANILLTPDGGAKVADLGLALQQDDEDERVTRDGTTVGTVDYMSPEQARDSRATNVRSDIYSLGCTVYHMLTGVPPFAGGDVADKLRRHASEVPPDLRALRPDLPTDIAGIVARMLAKKPENRFANYDELLAALDAIPPRGQGGGGPLEALIVDDESDVPDGPLDAIVLDDDEGDDFAAGSDVPLGSTTEASTIQDRPTSSGLRTRAASRNGSSRRPQSGIVTVQRPETSPPTRDEINLADLAKLDDDAIPLRKPPRPRPPVPTPSPLMSALEDDDTYPVVRGLPAARYTYAEDDSVQTWIVRGLLIGVAIVLLGFGIMQLLTMEFFPPAASESPGQATVGAVELEAPIE